MLRRFSRRLEGGTASVSARLAGLRRLALEGGYPWDW